MALAFALIARVTDSERPPARRLSFLMELSYRKSLLPRFVQFATAWYLAKFMFLTRLFKWILIVLLVLAVTALVVVWPVLGVNPFEGRQEHLWSLASNQVDFFIRFPGTRVLEEPLIEGLVDDPDFEALANLKDELRRATAEVAREVNPKIPLGLLEVDLNADFLGREMALAGAWQTDYSRPRLDNFIFMTADSFAAASRGCPTWRSRRASTSR
jgi:hypothetical protein